ncbi:DJ-1/PfpI family protein [Pseudonocardia alaniniphila]|uniref:DJ-1/PfpI family protein n=1 Tax=Pseudonocardia alaniniphila TaxID=75291 RepID=A0ABS9T963_9PSEU|nr:DJ-1/PfpI family protein [Pseudonocardia alaniniphila]MCH6164841.1 DJ-1/PfpI family protein [Pseudonocardia alaniniphila]
MNAAFVLYDNLTALDIVGPYEVLAGHSEVTPHFVAARAGKVRCDNGLTLHADFAFDDVPAPDLIVVPGSSQWRSALDDEVLIAWLASVHKTATWTTSVCSGSTLLAKAGILAGRRATSHWAVVDTLAADGAVVCNDRVVVDGNVITAAGVSAGIDMGLTLAATLFGEMTARTIQLAIEYDPEPPFDSGSPRTAPPEAVAFLRAALNGS